MITSINPTTGETLEKYEEKSHAVVRMKCQNDLLRIACRGAVCHLPPGAACPTR